MNRGLSVGQDSGSPSPLLPLFPSPKSYRFLTRPGLAWLLGAAIGLTIALFRSINLLALLSSLLLAMLALNLFLAGRRLTRLRARRRVPQPVFAGKPFAV